MTEVDLGVLGIDLRAIKDENARFLKSMLKRQHRIKRWIEKHVSCPILRKRCLRALEDQRELVKREFTERNDGHTEYLNLLDVLLD